MCFTSGLISQHPLLTHSNIKQPSAPPSPTFTDGIQRNEQGVCQVFEGPIRIFHQPAQASSLHIQTVVFTYALTNVTLLFRHIETLIELRQSLFSPACSRFWWHATLFHWQSTMCRRSLHHQCKRELDGAGRNLKVRQLASQRNSTSM